MRRLIAMVILFSAMATVGAMDHNDEREYDAYKCDMVKSGAWPKAVLKGVKCE